MKFGAIEAGGTKFVCSIGDQHTHIIKRVSFPTTTPEETLQQTIDFFLPYKEDLASIGIGSFGPIDIHPESPTYGHITKTPKEGWQFVDFVGTLKKHFPIPMAWTTDVNAAIYGEYVAGAAQSADSAVYFTIGTGIGGGAIQHGQFIEGFSHPEMGHMLVLPHADDAFTGACPFHKYCLEGMAAGPAIQKRFGRPGFELAEDDPYWEAEAYYLAQCAYSMTLILSPEKIIFGGGVMKQPQLLPLIHQAFAQLLNDYIETPPLEEYIVTPALEDNAATIGCLKLAQDLI